MQTPYEYDQKMQAARQRLRAALSPQDGREKSIVTWLGTWDLPTLEIIAEMVERAYERGRDAGETEAYELGQKAAELTIYDLGFDAGKRAAAKS